MNKTFEKKPLYKKWWFIAIAAFLLLGVIATIFEPESWKEERLQEEREKENAKELKEVTKKVGTVTPEEFNKLKKGMSYDEVKIIVGGKAKTESTNQFNEKLITYDYDGEKGVSKDSKVSLLFNDGKLDTIMQFGLLEPQVTESQPEEETKPVTQGIVETDKKEDIKRMVENIVSTDINTNMIKTNIKDITVNNYQAEENQYIILPYLKYELKSTKKTTVETLEMYSDHIAAKLYEQQGIEEITVFWEVPYHLTGENIAKFNYMRSPNGMAKNEKWLAPVLQ